MMNSKAARTTNEQRFPVVCHLLERSLSTVYPLREQCLPGGYYSDQQESFVRLSQRRVQQL